MEIKCGRIASRLAMTGWMAASLLAQDGEFEQDDTVRVETTRRQSSTVNGVVMLDSGMPPPEPIPIELTCESRAVSQVYTDRKGRFSVTLGQDSPASMLDASAPSPMQPGAASHSWFAESRPAGRCQLRIFLAGFQPQLLDVNEDGGIVSVQIGTVVLTRLAGSRGAAVSVTSYEAPKEARKHFESAFREAHKKKPNLLASITRLRSAVEIHPRYAAAWDLLGDCHLLTGETPEARRAYEAAIAADGDFLPPYAPLIRLAVADARWEDVAALAGERLRLSRGAEAAYFRSLALFRLGALDPAAEALDAARQSPDAGRFPQIALVQADLHAAKGRFRQAVEQYEAFLSQDPNSPARPEIETIVDGWRKTGKLSSD